MCLAFSCLSLASLLTRSIVPAKRKNRGQNGRVQQLERIGNALSEPSKKASKAGVQVPKDEPLNVAAPQEPVQKVTSLAFVRLMDLQFQPETRSERF